MSDIQLTGPFVTNNTYQSTPLSISLSTVSPSYAVSVVKGTGNNLESYKYIEFKYKYKKLTNTGAYLVLSLNNNPSETITESSFNNGDDYSVHRLNLVGCSNVTSFDIFAVYASNYGFASTDVIPVSIKDIKFGNPSTGVNYVGVSVFGEGETNYKPGNYVVSSGESFTVTSLPASGSKLTNVYIDNQAQTTISPTVSLTNITTIHSIIYSFDYESAVLHTLTVTKTGGGTVSPFGAVRVLDGESVTVNAVPGVGYKIDHITVNGTQYANDCSYTFDSITADSTVDVTFVAGTQTKLSVNASATGNGTGYIYPSTAISALPGEDVVLSFVPDEDSAIMDVSIDGVSQGIIETYSFKNISVNHTAIVTFTNKATIGNIVRIKRGRIASWSGQSLLDGELGYDKSNNQLRIGINPLAATEFASCPVVTGGSGGGTGGSSTWGNIGGTLSNQTDLISALNAKVSTSRKINGLTLTSDITLSIPTKLTDLFDDSTHRLVSDTQISLWNAKQNALGFTAENSANKGIANGYAPLGSDGKVPSTYLAALSLGKVTSGSSFPSGPVSGDICVRTDEGKTYIYDGTQWISLAFGTGITSINGYIGPVVSLTKADIGLGNVLNVKQVKAPNTATPGQIPTWKTSGDELDSIGYDVVTSISASASNTKIPTEKAVKDAISSMVFLVDSSLSDISTNPVQNKIVKAALDLKVDKVDGLGLSEVSFTAAEKTKLAGVETGAQVNVNADWSITTSTVAGFIKNKPGIVSNASLGMLPAFSSPGLVPVSQADGTILWANAPGATAQFTSYDNTKSGLSALNVQDAIDALDARLDSVMTSNLQQGYGWIGNASNQAESMRVATVPPWEVDKVLVSTETEGLFEWQAKGSSGGSATFPTGAVGDLLVCNGGQDWVILPAGPAGTVLMSQGPGLPMVWVEIGTNLIVAAQG